MKRFIQAWQKFDANSMKWQFWSGFYALLMIALLTVLLRPIKVQAAATHTVTLNWLAPAASSLTLTGYNVYRLAGACPAQPSLSAFTKLTSTPLSATTLTYSDAGLADAVTNCYAPTAVYGTVESGAGFFAQATTTLVIAATPATPPSAATATASISSN